MKPWRSRQILQRPEWSNVRSLFKSMGYSDVDLSRPLIGIANSWSRLVPGHLNLRELAEQVKQGVIQAGGTPMEFGVIGACDGLANGNVGMHYILPSRDLIAHDVEIMVEAHRLDAVVLLGSCDKIVPGMLMAAARLDVPAIFVAGGPMLGGCRFDGRASDSSTPTEALHRLEAGQMSAEEYLALEDCVAPTCGSCSFLGTANSMCCLAEALGMSLPGSATVPAVYAERLRIAQESGRRIVGLLEEGLTARRIIDRRALENALRAGLAIGASTNMALHLPAIGYEAEVEVSMDWIDSLSRSTPVLARINPAGPDNVPDFHAAGGVPAVMKSLLPLLQHDALTVTGRTVAENLAGLRIPPGSFVRPLDDPWQTEGGLAVLRGNLAPRTAVTKPAAIAREMRRFSGPARCFDGEEAALEAIAAGTIREGEVLVIRYEGPKGGPGMREMWKAMKLLYGRGLALKTALVTDGRFSGSNNGCFVGHVSPEAAEGGPLAAVQDGDRISIDIPARTLHLDVSEAALQERLARWRRPRPKIDRGYLALYARLACSADQGAVIRTRDLGEAAWGEPPGTPTR
jgi:dihydroxy-acid dehydratase